ncbi:MAG: glycerophosphoryl diester phosphodiesterase [Verrucomicrobiota bacterium JB022]|nr:glycerophosphoryl diester phosphodiesterase [Verrucomicrobiota bacterium JB022]
MKWLIFCLAAAPLAAETLVLEDSACRLSWEESSQGWQLVEVALKTAAGEINAPASSGAQSVIFSAEEPSQESRPFYLSKNDRPFPEPIYRYNIAKWQQATTPVALNEAGEHWSFWPATADLMPDGSLHTRATSDQATVTTHWQLDPSFPGDVVVTQTLTARRSGYFSQSTPTLFTAKPDQLAWATVPGYFQGDTVNENLVESLVYGHGLPALPVLARERGTSSLTSIQTVKNGLTLAVTAAPGTAADPWPQDRAQRAIWKLGLSHRNRQGALAPTLYHPVLGEEGSFLKTGESVTFTFRYSLSDGDWYRALQHVARDIYRLPDFLELKQPQTSLSERLIELHEYVVDDETSMWRTEEFGGLKIGAQAYLGGVVRSDRDAMKNSDYGAMWMLANLTQDPRLTEDRLPFARNFKLAQQQIEGGFFQGAALGQYFLSKSRRFTEEWGDYIEPVALTYYMLLDLGNILLITPGDAELRDRVRLAADRLLAWQHEDGHWEVAYDHETEQPLFTATPDYRPTFYGLLVAYRLLGDERYLKGAEQGAQWLIEHAVAHGRFLGVCGDNRFAPDFATAQIAQGLLDLYELTANEDYLQAAIQTARFYTTAIFTHPRATTVTKEVKGEEVPDWAINQTGLSFEHGGSIGSAATEGPILLASHAGLFIRMAEITGDTYLVELARAATLARDAFVNKETQVASYYWVAMNRGAGPYPHHGWWQIGWITDYLISEASYRTHGAVRFPRGFMTPKVGPHACYGFAPGEIFGQPAQLAWLDLDIGNAAVDYVAAEAPDGSCSYVILLNQSPQVQEVKADLPQQLKTKKGLDLQHVTILDSTNPPEPAERSLRLPAWGARIVRLDWER